MKYPIRKFVIFLVFLPTVTAKCDNSCFYSYDERVRRRWGKMQHYSSCTFGSDCSDCGRREYGEYYEKTSGSCPTILSSTDSCKEGILSMMAEYAGNFTILEMNGSNQPSGCFVNVDFAGDYTMIFNKKMGNTNFASRCKIDRICICQHTEGESSGDTYTGDTYQIDSEDAEDIECGIGYKVEESYWGEYSCKKMLSWYIFYI